MAVKLDLLSRRKAETPLVCKITQFFLLENLVGFAFARILVSEVFLSGNNGVFF